jgi:putative transcriptional regulator
VHLAATDLHAVDAIDKATMRSFDLACFTPVEPLPPAKIKAVREKAKMS